MQRCASESERTAGSRPTLGSRCGPEKLLRHNPQRGADEANRGESERRAGKGNAAVVPEPGGDGRDGGMDTGSGNTARLWYKPAAEQHLPGRAGSKDETTRV